MSAVRMGLDLAAKVVIVTGAARGLGQEFARSLAAAGARVVIGDVSACDATLDLVTADKGEAVGARLDVTDPQSAQALVEAGLRAFGRLDGLVNNAALYGALHGGRFTRSTRPSGTPAWRSTSRASGTAARRRCRRCAGPAAAALSTSPRWQRPMACRTACTTRRQRRR